MLIAIRHPQGVVEGAEYAKSAAEHMAGHTQIYNPRNLQDYSDTLGAYKPSAKNHLILLSTADDLGRERQPLEVSRLLEYGFLNRGGLAYGIQGPETLGSWVGDLPDSPLKLVKNARVSSERAIYSRKTLGATYFGRLTTDPHTVLVGVKPSGLLKASGIMTQIITSLPKEWGVNNENSRASDWSGVAFFKPANVQKLQEAAEWLASSNLVALGEAAHEALSSFDEIHGAVPMPQGNGRFNGQLTTPKYGMLIRDVAKTHDIKLDWKP